MKNFTDYTAEDFATEPLFIRWVQQPDDREIGNFWNLWLGNHPYKKPDVETARNIVDSFETSYSGLESYEMRSLWQRIQYTVHDLPEIKPLEKGLKYLASSIYIGRWLFALVVFIGLMGWLVWFSWVN